MHGCMYLLGEALRRALRKEIGSQTIQVSVCAVCEYAFLPAWEALSREFGGQAICPANLGEAFTSWTQTSKGTTLLCLWMHVMVVVYG